MSGARWRFHFLTDAAPDLNCAELLHFELRWLLRPSEPSLDVFAPRNSRATRRRTGLAGTRERRGPLQSTAHDPLLGVYSARNRHDPRLEVRSAFRFWRIPHSDETPLQPRPHRVPLGAPALPLLRGSPGAGACSDRAAGACGECTGRRQRGEAGAEAVPRPARRPGGPHRPLPGPAVEPGAHGVDVPPRDHPASIRPRRRRHPQTTRLPILCRTNTHTHPPHVSRRPFRQRHPRCPLLLAQPSAPSEIPQRLPGAAAGRHERGAALAQEGEGRGEARVERQDEGRDEGGRV